MDKEKRYRNWVVLVFSEKAPSDWKERLSHLCEMGVCSAFISPLRADAVHPYFRVVLMFERAWSRSDVRNLASEFGGRVFGRCFNVRPYVRYMCYDCRGHFREGVECIGVRAF